MKAQSKPPTPLGRFTGRKRQEHLVPDLFRDTAPVVSNDKSNISPQVLYEKIDGWTSFRRNGFICVANNV